MSLGNELMRNVPFGAYLAGQILCQLLGQDRGMNLDQAADLAVQGAERLVTRLDLAQTYTVACEGCGGPEASLGHGLTGMAELLCDDCRHARTLALGDAPWAKNERF